MHQHLFNDWYCIARLDEPRLKLLKTYKAQMEDDWTCLSVESGKDGIQLQSLLSECLFFHHNLWILPSKFYDVLNESLSPTMADAMRRYIETMVRTEALYTDEDLETVKAMPLSKAFVHLPTCTDNKATDF